MIIGIYTGRYATDDVYMFEYFFYLRSFFLFVYDMDNYQIN